MLSHGGLMLDARRTTLQLPLMREVTALQRNLRTLQDPGTSSSVTTSGGSSAGGQNKKGRTQTFIGDPHQDAQALARELSGKLAKSTNVNHGARLPQPESTKPNLRIERLLTKRRGVMKSKGTTAEDAASEPEMELGVRERIQRIESALHGRSRSTNVSGELRKEGLIRELKERGRKLEELGQQPERGASLSQLLLGINDPNGYSSRSAPNLLRMVQDEEQRASQVAGESLFESTDEEIDFDVLRSGAPMATKSVSAPLSMRGKEELKKPLRKKKKPVSARLRERSIKLARKREPPAPATIIIDDDELAVSELPNGCGVAWDWPRIHKYGGRAFLDLTGLTCTLPESSRDARHELPELHPPVQSISSLDSDANALPLLIGEDAHDSDLAGFYFRSQEKHSGKRKASLQDAVKDVPGNSSPTPSPIPPHRTLTQKYRPKNLKEIVGQPVVVKSLSTAILKSKVAPVYLFSGPRGTGKTSAARVFAAGLNCMSPDLETRPCGLCRECGTLALNRSADVRQIDAAANVDLPSLRAMMGSFTPHARYKIFIVENCDLLSSEIWKSFLKLLEEPPVNVVFILVSTDADRIPATANSRCQKFQFLKLKGEDIVKRLELIAGREGLVVEAGAFALIATRADGSLRDAEIILDQLCLVHKTVSVSAVQELVGLLPDHKVFDLLDQALSANTVNIVRTMREVLAAGVEPLALVAQLGSLITDILVGSVVVNRDDNPAGFFSRKFSEKEEVHRLRQALKILSEAEKQLRVATDGATWLAAALLQFAPDRSFLPSDVTTSPDVVEPRQATSDPQDDPEIEAPDETHAASVTLQEDAGAVKPSPEVENHGSTLSEQKLEEAWGGEQPAAAAAAPQAEDATEGVTPASAATSVAFQLFHEEALAELWKRVVWEVSPRNLKNMLQTQGRLVAAGVAVDGSCAVVELEFHYARDKHKAERSWRSICIAFQAVLSTAVELRIALSTAFPEESEVVRASLPTPPGSPTRLQPTPVKAEPSPAASPRRPPRRRGARTRRHRHATEILDSELGAQFSSDVSGITPRRPPPPSRRRRVKKHHGAAAGTKPASTEIEVMDTTSSRSMTREIWETATTGTKPEKKLLSSMMEEPLSEIDDLVAAQTKIYKQQNMQFRNDPSLSAAVDRRSSLIADLQRGLPPEGSILCWSRGSPQSEFLMRKSRVKSVRKAEGKARLLRMVPCAATSITPPSSAPPQVSVA